MYSRWGAQGVNLKPQIIALTPLIQHCLEEGKDDLDRTSSFISLKIQSNGWHGNTSTALLIKSKVVPRDRKGKGNDPPKTVVLANRRDACQECSVWRGPLTALLLPLFEPLSQRDKCTEGC